MAFLTTTVKHCNGNVRVMGECSAATFFKGRTKHGPHALGHLMLSCETNTSRGFSFKYAKARDLSLVQLLEVNGDAVLKSPAFGSEWRRSTQSRQGFHAFEQQRLSIFERNATRKFHLEALFGEFHVTPRERKAFCQCAPIEFGP